MCNVRRAPAAPSVVAAKRAQSFSLETGSSPEPPPAPQVTSQFNEREHHPFFAQQRAAIALASGRSWVAPTTGSVEDRANAVLGQFWGAQYRIRPFQLRVVRALLEQRRDVVVVSGTGSGKSLCFQIPPLIAAASVAIVISPLISLMRDQCAALAARGVRCAFVGSAQRDKSVERRAMTGAFSLLYMCPETLQRLLESIGDLHGRLLRDGAAAPLLLAVDEAHCVSKVSALRLPLHHDIHLLSCESFSQ